MKCLICNSKNTEVSGKSITFIKCKDCGHDGILLDQKLAKKLKEKN